MLNAVTAAVTAAVVERLCSRSLLDEVHPGNYNTGSPQEVPGKQGRFRKAISFFLFFRILCRCLESKTGIYFFGGAVLSKCLVARRKSFLYVGTRTCCCNASSHVEPAARFQNPEPTGHAQA